MGTPGHTEAVQSRLELDAIKSRMHENSLQTGSFEIIGALGGEPPTSNWTGDISLRRRIESGELSEADVQTGIDFLQQCYVATQRGARIRCIDGRTIIGYDDDNPEDFGRKLGPQVPGGTPIQGVAYRLSLGGQDGSYARTNLGHDIELLAGKAVDLGFLAGDHVDDQHAAGKTGCRAIDEIEDHVERISPGALLEIEATTKALLGRHDRFNPAHFDHVIASSARLLAVEDSYFLGKDEIISQLVRHNEHAAPTLTGEHTEFMLVFNFVKGETFHTDHFGSEFDGKLEVFNYDVWHTIDMGRALFPDDEDLQSKYVHARMALATTAMMDLSDGSLLAGVRDDHEFSLAA